ncbi:MAG: ABC transporter substrate-binding protein [Ignavibacteriales bacterium]|nr:ABC transporter substrate-binding protein [Ignavibacteriales bacterium]
MIHSLKAVILSLFFIPFVIPQQKYVKTTFLVSNKHLSQFAGFIIAKEKGLYKKNGLDVEFIFADRTRTSDALLNKKADFALLLLPAAIELAGRGEKIVNIAQLMQKSSFLFVAKKTSGISKTSNLQGKKAGVWDGDMSIYTKAFMKKIQSVLVPIYTGSSTNLFLMEGVDVSIARFFDDYHTITNSGMNPDELIPFYFRDFGLDFPEEGIYCLEEKYTKSANQCNGFVNASLAGWQYAYSHQEESIGIILKYLKLKNFPVSRVHLEWMFGVLFENSLVKDNSAAFGRLSEKSYENTSAQLLTLGLIKSIPPYKSFYRKAE